MRGYRMLPPSPNWYSSLVGDFSPSGLYAFGCKNNISVMDSESGNFVGQLQGHSGRITAVQFFRTSTGEETFESCVSSAVDGKVRSWNVTGSSCTGVMDRHKTEVSCVSCSPLIPGLVVSGDKDGYLVAWDTKKNSTVFAKPVSSAVMSVACSSRAPYEVAVGYQNGSVCLIDVSTGDVTQRFTGHENEVCSVAWSCSKALPLLASASKDKSIRIWKCDDGNAIKTFQPPKPPTDLQKPRVWISVSFHPTEENTLYSSSHVGDLLVWNVADSKPKAHTLTGGHSRSIFSIALNTTGDKCITVSLDRNITMWDLKEEKPRWILPSLGGFAYHLDMSETDPGKLAVAVGDSTIRVWDTLSTKSNSYECALLWKGLQSKVTCVSWHPQEPNVLAFGCEDGRVGVYDVGSQKVNASVAHRGIVYEVQWHREGDRFVLYTCGDGNIFQCSPNAQFKKVDINNLIGEANSAQPSAKFPKRSEIAFGPQGLTAVGNADGSVEIFSPDWKLLRVYADHRLLVNRIKWRESSDSTSPPYLASCSEDGTIRVYQVKIDEATPVEEASPQPSLPYGSLTERVVLVKHGKSVVSIAWCPSNPQLLASASFDSTIQVWEIPSGKPLCNLRGHTGRVMSVAWSSTDQDLLYSASDDQTVRSWSISRETKFDSPPEVSREKKKPAPKKQPEPVADTPSVSEAVAVPSTAEPAVESVKPQSDIDKEKESKAAPTATAAKKETKKESKKPKSLLPLTRAQTTAQGVQPDLQRDCVRMAQGLGLNSISQESEPTTSDVSVEPRISNGLFETAEETLRLMEAEQDAHIKDGRMEAAAMLDIWRGDFSAALRTLLSSPNTQITPLWMAIAPMAGLDIWAKMATTLAMQHAARGDHHTAVTILLSLNDVRGAIQTYLRAEMFEEALALSQVRLIPEDPMIESIYTEWAQALERRGQYELAGKCYLAGGKMAQAVHVLSRRNFIEPSKEEPPAVPDTSELPKVYQQCNIKRAPLSVLSALTTVADVAIATKTNVTTAVLQTAFACQSNGHYSEAWLYLSQVPELRIWGVPLAAEFVLFKLDNEQPLEVSADVDLLLETYAPQIVGESMFLNAKYSARSIIGAILDQLVKWGFEIDEIGKLNNEVFRCLSLVEKRSFFKSFGVAAVHLSLAVVSMLQLTPWGDYWLRCLFALTAGRHYTCLIHLGASLCNTETLHGVCSDVLVAEALKIFIYFVFVLRRFLQPAADPASHLDRLLEIKNVLLAREPVSAYVAEKQRIQTSITRLQDLLTSGQETSTDTFVQQLSELQGQLQEVTMKIVSASAEQIMRPTPDSLLCAVLLWKLLSASVETVEGPGQVALIEAIESLRVWLLQYGRSEPSVNTWMDSALRRIPEQTSE